MDLGVHTRQSHERTREGRGHARQFAQLQHGGHERVEFHRPTRLGVLQHRGFEGA
ncbi:MAG: hypothetical protein RLZ03_1860, partial [Pseudomonadota bacterium]